jgi:hypothetical protein
MGKTPEYVAIYAMAYRDKKQELQVKNASIGCGIAGICYAISLVVQLVIKD